MSILDINDGEVTQCDTKCFLCNLSVDECVCEVGACGHYPFCDCDGSCEDDDVDDCEDDAQVKREATLESAKFAAVTRTAHAMVPLITQEFEVRFKGSDEAFRTLKYAGIHRSASQLVGKTFKVTVDWSSLGGALWLYCEGRLSFCILPSEFKKVFTQKGKIMGMCEFWKDASGYNSLNK